MRGRVLLEGRSTGSRRVSQECSENRAEELLSLNLASKLLNCLLMRVNFYTDILNEFIVIIIIVTMGPSPSSPQVTHFNPNDWLYAKENGYCLILKNTRTGQEVEEYDMLPKGDITMH